MLPDEPTEEERLEQTDNDSATTPFQPADDVADDGISTTHPVTDAEVDPGELYAEGIGQATDGAEPNQKSDVLGYDKTKDQRQVNNDA